MVIIMFQILFSLITGWTVITATWLFLLPIISELGRVENSLAYYRETNK